MKCTKRQLSQIVRRCKRLKISQESIASAACSDRSPNGVDRTMVSKVFNGKATSRPVIEAALRLIAERQQQAECAA